MDYRWERASGGEIPSGAWEKGHGWEWRDTDDGQEQEPLWVARSVADSGAGDVRLGYARRGQGAFLGGQRQPVGEYEVLLDEGRWAAGDWVQEPYSDDCYIEVAGVGGVACGHTTDGSPLYATLRDREGEGLAQRAPRARTAASAVRFWSHLSKRPQRDNRPPSNRPAQMLRRPRRLRPSSRCSIARTSWSRSPTRATARWI